MSQPISVDILSDDDEPDFPNQNDFSISTPHQTHKSKNPKTDSQSNPTIFLVDDGPTPQKPPNRSSDTPSFVAETPLSDQVLFVKCSKAVSDAQFRASSSSDHKFSGISGLICLESDNESESDSGREKWKENDTIGVGLLDMEDTEFSSRSVKANFSSANEYSTQISGDSSAGPTSLHSDTHQAQNNRDEENFVPYQIYNVGNHESGDEVIAEKKNRKRRAPNTNITKEERIRVLEEKKLKKEQEKLQKAALKAEAAEMKKLEKEKKKWENGKFALKSIVAEIDTKVVELGSVGGHLLSRLSEKGLAYRIKSNPVEKSIVWTMNAPEEISKVSSDAMEIPYILLLYEAEEFCNHVMDDSLMRHISTVRSHYPSYTICYTTNRLKAYIHKREQSQYKNPTSSNGWRRPPVEEAFSKLTTHFDRVHSRQCIDEAEVAEHVVGLTTSLATCHFRKKLTRLSVNANGSLIPKDSVDRNLIKNSVWLKALVAIPKVQPRFAIAISKKYPTMKSLLRVYMDPTKSVHEKEFLLKDLPIEGLLGDNRRLGEICSKRVYRILMAQSGSIETDDVEDGADFFARQSSS